MGEVLEPSALERWQREPTAFISEVIRNPETDEPFELLPCELRFFEHAYKTNDAGRLLYPEQGFSAPKKTCKTTFNGMHTLTTTLVYGGRFAEAYVIANDLEQAQGRVFAAIRRMIEASPYLRREAKITANRIEFPATGATITAIASDYASAAGANPTISSFDELWAYTSQRSERLWDEMTVPPTRKIACRLTTTYAGFSGESKLLEDFYKRGLAQPQIGPDLYAGGDMLMYWTHEPQAPWQTEEWIEQQRRSLRPHAFIRMIENRFSYSEESFVDPAWWDACAIARPVLADPSMSVWVAVDASAKRDSTGIVAVTWDQPTKRPRMVWHKIINPTKNMPIDFEAHIEEVLLGLKSRFRVREVRYDPWQMLATAQRMKRAGLNMVEFAQTNSNLTAASQNLYELIKGENLICYPDNEIRLAISRAVAAQNERGWRIKKDKASHKIDIVVALAMAALGAVKRGGAQIRTWCQDGSYLVDGVRYYPEGKEKTALRVVHVNEEGAEITPQEAQAIRAGIPQRRRRV